MQIYPVISVTNPEAAGAMAAQAFAQPVAGVFLINHDADDALLCDALDVVRAAFPDAFVGVNVIRRPYADSLEVLRRRYGDQPPVSALWCDRIDFEAAPMSGPGRPLHFGGVAFKYQAPVPIEELPELARAAAAVVDVVTTSGPGTGQAADLAKLHALREGLGSHPLALASGVTPENGADYLGLVQHVLVSTGIADGLGGIDADRLAALLELAASPQPGRRSDEISPSAE